MNDQTLFVGIDLGSFKTSAVCSNGNRYVIPTAVGWPKDAIGRRMLGKEVVFGDELAAHRRALNVVRPFERGVLKYVDAQTAGVPDDRIALHLKAARLVVEHVVGRLTAGDDRTVFGAIGAPSQASSENHKLIREAASSTVMASLIVHEPFAVGYGMDKLNQTLVVDIGAGTIDICPMFGAYPDASEQVTIPLGGDIIDQAIYEGIRQHHPEAACSLETATRLKEKYGSVQKGESPTVVTLHVNGVPQLFDISDILRAACGRLIEPIASGIWQVVSKLAPEYHRPLMNNIILAGGASQMPGLDHQVEAALEQYGGGVVSKVYDSVFAGAFGALKLAMDTPTEQWDRVVNQSKAA